MGYISIAKPHIVTGQQKDPILPKLTDDMFVRTVCFQRGQWKCSLTHERPSHPWLTKLKPSSQAPGSTDGNQEVSFPIDTYENLPPGYRPAPNQACRIFKEPVILAGSLYCDWRVSLSEIDDPAHGLDLPHQTPYCFKCGDLSFLLGMRDGKGRLRWHRWG